MHTLIFARDAQKAPSLAELCGSKKADVTDVTDRSEQDWKCDIQLK